MFSSISPPPHGSRRRAALYSAAVHVAAVAALWAAGRTITAPPMPPYEPREALLVVPPPPRLFRPRTQPKAVQRFEIERAAAPRTPEAVRAEPQAPKVEVRTEPAPALPQEPAIEVKKPAPRPTGFAEVARAVVPKLELEPKAAAFGAALARPEAASVVPSGGGTAFGAAGLARKQASVAAGGNGGFEGVEAGRAARRSGTSVEAGFGAAERGLASATASEAPTTSRNRPVKILWKPVPQYSEEGIRRRIEGDVVLLVRFLAQGTVETLRVVSGLGYGLDEYALQAAQSIRFEPATEGDRAVDYTTQVRIRFELAY